ncbi:hypothetical protein BJV77DRAFT_706914 [Russula vinacea]|nr:hypothetical protein BJV77DRAFT_706914 [Russula vinacea]
MRHQIAQQQTAQQRHFVFNSCKNSSWHRYGNRPGTTASHVQDLSTSRFFSFGCTTGDLCVAQTTSYVRSSHVITYTLCGKRSRKRLLVLIRSSYSILSLYLNTGIVWIVRCRPVSNMCAPSRTNFVQKEVASLRRALGSRKAGVARTTASLVGVCGLG